MNSSFFCIFKHIRKKTIMKLKTIIGLIFIFTVQFSKAQIIEELYNKRDFPDLIKYADKADELTGEELYYVGYSFFQLEDDLNAIKMYDKAIEKGLDEDYIYLYKGLSLRYNHQNEAAIKNFKLAVEKNPKGQKNHTELGNSYYFQENYDTALIHFYKARELPYEIGDPYLKIPNIYHIKQDFDKAIEEYNISTNLINKEDPIYLELIKEIGLLEYSVFKQFDKSITAYTKVIELTPKDYDFYPKLIKAYYANEAFDKGDSLINVLKSEFEKGNLSDDFQKYGNVPIAEFEWNNQKIVAYKYFIEPEETLDLMYKIYLLSKDSESVERTLMTEKTIVLEEGGVKHLLCEREKNGVHHTYPFGWSTDKIDFNSLKEAVIAVLNERMKPSASSNFATQKKKKKKKKGDQ